MHSVKGASGTIIGYWEVGEACSQIEEWVPLRRLYAFRARERVELERGCNEAHHPGSSIVGSPHQRVDALRIRDDGWNNRIALLVCGWDLPRPRSAAGLAGPRLAPRPAPGLRTGCRVGLSIGHPGLRSCGLLEEPAAPAMLSDWYAGHLLSGSSIVGSPHQRVDALRER